jgi:hypothetical protein
MNFLGIKQVLTIFYIKNHFLANANKTMNKVSELSPRIIAVVGPVDGDPRI